MNNQHIEPIHQKMEYGAPDLIKNHKRFLSLGLLFTIGFLIFCLTTYGISVVIAEKNKQIQTSGLTVVELQNQNIDSKDEESQQQNIEAEKVNILRDDAALIPEPVARERADTTKFKTQSELDKIKTVVSSEGDINADPNKEFTGELKVIDKEKIQIEIKKEENVEKKIYQVFEVEKAPATVNLNEVRQSMRYPEIARSAEIEGRVTVKVLVGPDGTIEKIGSISGPDVFYDEVSSKVINLQFTPALQNGKAVSCWVSVPFNFTLTGKFKKEEQNNN